MKHSKLKRLNWLFVSSRSVLIAAACCLMSTTPASTQTTRTYAYDVLGRLVKVTPGTGTPVCYSLDPADNRKIVAAAAGCTPAMGTGAANLPPVATNDYFAVMVTAQPYVGDFPVLINDTDQNLPNDTMTITSITGPGSANITIVGGTYLHWSGTALGSKHLTYTIRDAANATSTAFLDIDFVSCPGGVCP
jgi:hypothetical protein